MRTIYILFFTSIAVACLLIALSFVYFEKADHDNLYYVIEYNGKARGSIEIDAYKTEEQDLFKARTDMPFEAGLNRSNSRLVIDRSSGSIKEFFVEREGDLVKELYLIKPGDKGLSFLAVADSQFSYLPSMSTDKGVLPYNSEYPVTWLPIVERYDFKLGGNQVFGTVRISEKMLPPYRGMITLTYASSELVNIDGRRMRASQLILRERAHEPISIWVDKSSHRFLAAKKGQFYLHLSGKKRTFVAKDYFPDIKGVITKKITLTVKGKEIGCVFARPAAKGVYPVLVLSCGSDVPDGGMSGLAIDIVQSAASQGFVAITYTPEPIDKTPQYASVSINDELDCISACIDYIEEYRFANLDKIAVVGISDANYYISQLLKKDPRIKAWVMLSPKRLEPVMDTDTRQIQDILAKIAVSDKAYKDDVFSAHDRTLETVEESSQDRKTIMDTKVYLGRMKEIARLNPLDDLKEVKLPILVIQGKNDDRTSLVFFKSLYSAMEQPGREVVFLRDTDHFLGRWVLNDEVLRDHLSEDPNVTKTLCGWLAKNL